MSINISLQGSRDNMSIIIIAFPGAPKVDPEAVRKEDELNKLIKQKVTGQLMPLVRQTLNFKTVVYFADIIKENDEDISFSAVFQQMVEEGFDDLPPGGGIQSK